ncbi:hypothetical protein AC59_4411 [Escherichia coli 3-373-03_S3_C3]|nr:hypothetical protein AC59_4411 [Escherichia coli 3-373-03_S3_C3]KDU07929.1 hypothetical protein AC34_4422 [Escherichia coli 3-373-03_S3_C2]
MRLRIARASSWIEDSVFISLSFTKQTIIPNWIKCLIFGTKSIWQGNPVDSKDICVIERGNCEL